MAFTAYSAKNAKVRYGGTTITANSWSVEPSAARLKTTNFESGGFETGITGIRNITFTIELDDDAAQSLFDVPVTAGLIATSNLLLYVNSPSGLTGPFWSIAGAHFTSLPMKAQVEDTMKVTITGSGNGQWTYPTGTHSGTT